jgi:RHS repeat-associated protein
VDGVPVTTSPFQVPGPFTNACEFYRLRSDAGWFPQTGGLQPNPLSNASAPSVTLYTYDAEGNRTSVTDANGNTTWYAYDERGRLIYTTNALGSVTAITYDAASNKISETDANGHTTWYAYDAQNRPAYITNALGCVTASAYDPVGNQIAATDANGHTTTFTYDCLNRLIATTNALGYVTQNEYDAGPGWGGGGCRCGTNGTGRIIEQTDANGHITYFTYDALGRLLQTIRKQFGTADVIEAGDAVTTYTYDPNGNRLSVVAPNNTTNSFGYDALNRTISSTNGLGYANTFVYDAVGNLIAKVDAAGGITRFSYDALNWLATTTNALGYATSHAYDPVGNIIGETDANGHTSTFAYDCLNRLTAATNSLGYVTTFAYDAVGNKICATDALGHITRYAFDGMNQLVFVTNALGYVTAFNYDATGNKTTETDANGHSTSYAYDALNRPVYMTNALHCVTANVYDPVGNKIAATDADGHTSTFAYDFLNRQIAMTNALGCVTQFEYDAGAGGGGCGCGASTKGTDRIVEQTDANGKVTYFKYDAVGQLLKTVRKQFNTNDVIDPDDAVTTYTYDPNGNRLLVIDPNNITNSVGYDALNRPIAGTNGAGDVMLRTYDPVGNVLTVTAPNGNITTNTYDPLDHLVQVNDSIGLVATHTYDSVGNRLSVTDGNTNSTTYAYDALNQLATTTDAMGSTSTNYYDPVGNLTRVIDRMTNSTLYAYDAVNRRTNTVDALGCVTSYAYDGVGNLLAITDANNHTTSYEYDALNHKVRDTYPDSPADIRTYAYDAVGNLASRTDQEGNTTLYLYSDLYYLTNRIYASDPSDRFTYDLGGRMLTACKTNWLTTNDWIVTFAYDGANRVTNTTQGGRTISYSYDIPGRTLTLTYPSGTNITQTTDARGRLLTVGNEQLPPTVTYTYDPGNRVLTRACRNGVVAEYAYNPNNWITSLLHTNPATGTLIAGFTYAYDQEGNKLYEENLWNTNRSEAYACDPMRSLTNWLAGNLVNGTVPAPTNSQQWQLDCLGNWNSTVTNGITQIRTHNEANEITAIDANPLYYDANGNLANDGRYIYSYDEENRLNAVTLAANDEAISQYAYDALGRRIESLTEPETEAAQKWFFYNQWRVIEVQGAAGVSEASFIYGGLPREILGALCTTNVFYCHQNAIGSVIAATDETGSTLERYAYDAYGTVTITDGAGGVQPPNSWGTAHSAIGNLFTFQGQQADEETGLFYFGYRFYSPLLGRFLCRDPFADIMAGMTKYGLQALSKSPFGGAKMWYADYVFAENNPTEKVDVLGLCDESCNIPKAVSQDASYSINLGRGVKINVGTSATFEFEVCGVQCPRCRCGVKTKTTYSLEGSSSASVGLPLPLPWSTFVSVSVWYSWASKGEQVTTKVCGVPGKPYGCTSITGRLGVTGVLGDENLAYCTFSGGGQFKSGDCPPSGKPFSFFAEIKCCIGPSWWSVCATIWNYP